MPTRRSTDVTVRWSLLPLLLSVGTARGYGQQSNPRTPPPTAVVYQRPQSRTPSVGAASGPFAQGAPRTPPPTAVWNETRFVVGTVKHFEPGKSITVTGPKYKDYSFDLDENVASPVGTVHSGDKVKVTYTKHNGDQKATAIVPYSARTKPGVS